MDTSIALTDLSIVSGEKDETSQTLRILPNDKDFFCLTYKKPSNRDIWNPDRYLCIDLIIDTDRMPTVYFDFVSHSDGTEHILSVYYFLIPTARVKMVVKLSELDSHRYFTPTYPGSFKGHVRGEPTCIDSIDEIRIRMGTAVGFQSVEIFSLCLKDTLGDMQVLGHPLVDEMGQRKGYQWPGKMESVNEMVSYLRTELANAKGASSYPSGWSRYGGYRKLKFDATGYFHSHHDGKRWWLVDPDGYAFLSNGICYGARMGVHGFVDQMEDLFDWLPDPDDAMWKDCWTEASKIPEFVKRNGKESGKGRRMFNFARANMIRAFGPDAWWDAWVTINAARIRRWGFNTIGVGVNTYTDEHVEAFLEKANIPFVLTLKDFPLTKKTIYRDFPDVFSEEYRLASKTFAEQQLAAYRGNPLLIGYFITNEPEWLFQQTTNPAERLLAQDGDSASKNALIDFLQKRYGDIMYLNEAWNLDLQSFSDLKKPMEHADMYSEQSKKDLLDFRDILIQKYCEVPSVAAREVDPEHLNLGMRYSQLTPMEFAGNDAFDVCSFNCYRPSPRPMLDILKEKANCPGLIGEWHIAAREMRNFATGLVSSPTQEERTKAIRYYFEQAVSHVSCVGLHYFEMNDQPVLGRFDGECMQHGLISIANVPYASLSKAMEEFAQTMYELANGDLEPIQEKGAIYGIHA
ncbi:Beta-galactosidase [Sphaerochaeta pleomorpha str. Grapes]|uniref:Beta-galactosidase n=1 Tax=Sphaerochaeta pleomorpha (strain ATCC BAA-1885 / DSM 22778 / Grapes) TaxID=158190 RepID=G8QWA0_SPHPG|nr:beta-galactosidase [Sphaerochaeta pleomorpha]AEV29398.1 Beta-galactosidase [Sphaerochaeta pleomorpha str. Grapes]